MHHKLKVFIAALAIVTGLVGGPSATVSAQGAAGQAKTDVCAGVNVGGGTCADNGSGISNVLGVALNILSVIAGVAAVIMIVIAGLRYITSGGESSKISSAKSAIVYAIVGLVIVALSQLLVKYVLSKASGTGGPGA